MIKKRLQKKMLKKKLNYKIKQWGILSQLLESGYSLNESMVFLNTNQLQELDKHSFYDLYIKNFKGSFYNNLRFFYSLFPLDQAIKNSISIEEFKNNIIQKLVKTTVYPIFIFIISICILMFFSISILPQLIINFNIKSTMFNVVQMMPIIFNFIGIVIFVLMITVGTIYLINKSLFYFILKSVFIYIPIFKQIHSFYFLGYFSKLYECGLSSKACIEYLLKLKTYKVFNEMIYEINEKLNQGKSLIECIKSQKILSYECKESVLMAYKTKKQVNFYRQGLFLIEQNITNIIQKITRFITFFSYLVVLLVVLIMYQLMLIPLDMIQTM